ncbi:transcription antitermination factor NusB, partial [Mycobacterium sp. NAZ190054]|uniref:transcription antitermination protein NusB n=1 Tax=Mycobacterium sp. NAZ190054 TaxID=1747766 RepID=UPI0026F43499
MKRKRLDPARQAALDVLRAVTERDAYANLALPAILRDRGISGRDAAFATELAYGTCRTRGLLDAVIAAAAGRPVDRIDPVVVALAVVIAGVALAETGVALLTRWLSSTIGEGLILDLRTAV